MSYMSASTLGPVISIFLFAAHHNSWDPITLRNVFVVGIALEIFGGVAMLAFRDSCAIDGDGDDVAGVRRASPGASVAALPPAPALASTPAAALDSRPPTPSPRVVWWVPHLIFASNLVLGIASGMTIKFFPLYFRCSVHLSPVAVQAIYASQPALIAAFSRIATALATRIGRVHALIAFKVVGVALLVTMSLLEGWLLSGVAPHAHNDTDDCKLSGPDAVDDDTDTGSSGDLVGDGMAAPPTWKALVIVTIFLMRTALMNCTAPLTQALTMDSVPRGQRARWQSLSTVVRFGWCGSAAIGGVLADRYGYASTFLVTAGLQLAATVMQCGLLPVVPRFERCAHGKTAEGISAPATRAATMIHVAPLLAPEQTRTAQTRTAAGSIQERGGPG